MSQDKSARGIPIGNLTSQIFSNIYLNNFDRFVRHILKPQAYVRYGDDFILLAPTRKQVYRIREQATEYLHAKSGLAVNPKNDVVVQARAGLKFLGHAVTKSFTMVDKHTTRSVLAKVSWHNVASYRSLYLVEAARKELDWILLEKDLDL